MALANSRISLERMNFVTDSRCFTTCRIVSTNPSRPTTAGRAASFLDAAESCCAVATGRTAGLYMARGLLVTVRPLRKSRKANVSLFDDHLHAGSDHLAEAVH